MKKSSLVCALLVCIGLQSCKNSEKEKTVTPVATEAENPADFDYYQALYEQDTIDLKIKAVAAGKIDGTMTMKIFNMPVKEGELVGEFRGDTLFASYTFIQGGYEKKTYKNPMAFLKKENQLILGNGQIETSMGASYFVKGTPIDFERVKYKFSKVEGQE